MSDRNIPNIFKCLLSDTCIDKHDILGTSDGFYMVYKSIANILATKSIFDFPWIFGKAKRVVIVLYCLKYKVKLSNYSCVCAE